MPTKRAMRARIRHLEYELGIERGSYRRYRAEHQNQVIEEELSGLPQVRTVTKPCESVRSDIALLA